MRKLIMAIALAFAFVLPFTESSMASPGRLNSEIYVVNKPNTYLWQHSFGRGIVRCYLEVGDEVTRDWGDNWPVWIYVRVIGPHSDNWGCNGWISKKNLQLY